MTSLREVMKRLIRGELKPPPNRPQPEFAYGLYWTKMVRAWDRERRREIAGAIRQQLAEPGFQPNEYQRRYSVPKLDEQAHSGLSLLALEKVLAAFEESEVDE